MTAIIERQRARLNTQKAKKIAKRFYIQKARHFSKNKTISVTFLYTKSNTLDVTGFSWNFWCWHSYTKSMTLCVTWRLYIQKSRHFAKIKTICYTFLYTKIRHFCVTRFFIEFLKFAEGGGIYLLKNIMYFAWHFYIEKRCTLRYVARYKEPDTIRYILISKKQFTFLYVQLYIIYRTVLIPNYKRTYDQSDQIEK